MSKIELPLPYEFLDFKINEALPRFREEHKEEYDIVFEVINILDDIETKFTGRPDNEQTRYILSYIVELDKLFQSAVLMFERGLPRSANIIIRTILEVSLNIVDIIKNEKHIQEKASANAYEVSGSLKIIDRYNMYDLFPKQIIQELTNISSSISDKNNAEKLKPSRLSNKYGFTFEYLMYKMYCSDTHMSNSALNENIVDLPEKVIVNKDFNFNDFKQNIFLLVTIVIISFEILLEDYLRDNELINKYNMLLNNIENVFK